MHNKPFVAPLIGRDHMLIFTTPAHCLAVMRDHARLVRGWAYHHDTPVLGLPSSLPVLFANSGDAWQAQRLRANPFFGGSSVRRLFASIVARCRETETQLMHHHTGVAVDLKRHVATVTIGVMCTHIFGRALPPHVNEVLLDFFGNHLPREFLLRISGAMWLPLPFRWGYYRQRARMLQAVREQIACAAPGSFCELRPDETMEQKLVRLRLDRLKLSLALLSRKARMSFFGTWLTCNHKSDVVGLIFAGFETTSNIISWTLYLLMTHDSIRRELASEVTCKAKSCPAQMVLLFADRALVLDSAVLNGRLLDELNADDVRECKLLTACVNEALRLHTPAPGHVGDAVEDMEVDGDI